MARVGAIILAAGGSSRLGQPKQLLSLGGKSLLRRTFEAARDAGCSPVAVVLGAHADEIQPEIDSTQCVVVVNENWQKGIGSSIRKGMGALASTADMRAAILLVCDQLFVDLEHVRNLISAWDQTKKEIVASAYSGTLGVPALFDRACFGELLSLPNGEGAKKIIAQNPGRSTSIPFPAGEIDVDTNADADRLIRS